MDARLTASTRLVAALVGVVLAAPACQDSRPLGPEGRSPGPVQAVVNLPEQDEIGTFPKSGLFSVPSSGQTGAAGSADDPAIWVHPTSPALSLVIGTNKNTSGGLHVFDLNGTQLQFVAGGKHNNVDVRYGLPLGGQSVDIVSADDRNNNQLDLYKVDPATRQLTQVGTIQAGIAVYGYALYHSRPTGKFYAFVSSGDGVEQWELLDQGASIGGRLVRTFPTTHLIEGIAADDELGDLYLAEEDYGIFKYGAEPGDPTTNPVTVDVVGSSTQLVADVEGLTIYYRANGFGYLIASSQGNSRFVVYRREGANAHLGTFQIAAGAATSTDGIDVINMALGSLYPLGMFVAHDGGSGFRMVRWDDIANALGLAIHTQGYDVRGGACEGVASVDVAPTGTTIVEGATVQLTATPKDGSGAPVAGCVVAWSSDGPGVADVTSTGLVTGLADGMATITATTEGVGGSSTVTVTDADPVANFTFAPATPVVGQPVAFTDASTSVDGIQSWQWDFGDGPGGASTAQNPSHTYAAAGNYVVTLTVTEPDPAPDVATVTRLVTVIVQPSTVLYLSVETDTTLGGLAVANEDIVAFDGTGYTLYFDGSDVGIGGFTLDAFAVISPTEILMSFTSAGTVGALGTVDDSDVLKFTATSLGATTAGTFTMYFDASDVGLSTSDEDVDAIELLPDGRLLVSTTGAFGVTGVSGQDEDLIAFTPTSLGATTAGTWAMYFDGSDVELATSSSEDVDAVAVDALGRIYLSTTGSFAVPGVSGADEDVFRFMPTSLGGTTAGTYDPVLFFDGSTRGLTPDVKAIDLP